MIQVTKDDVKNTRAYNNLSKPMKSILISRNNVKNSIEHGVNLISNIGRKRWLEITNTSYSNKLIITEIADEKL